MSHYNVNPRYTSGSPAMVDRETAERVAAEEREAYSAHITGIYGEPRRAMADREGLSGIVEHVMQECRQLSGRGWLDGSLVHDVLTGEKYWRGATTTEKKQCTNASEHRPDAENMMLIAIPNHDDPSDVGITVAIPCKICGEYASTKPLSIFWPGDRR